MGIEKEDLNLDSVTGSLVKKKELSDSDIKLLIKEVILPFGNMLAPYKLYDYQEEVFSGICYAVIRRKGDDLSVLITRQGGKSYTLSVVVSTLGILLPALSNIFEAKQIKNFSDKFKVGIYGPDYDKAGIVYGRIKEVLTGEKALSILSSPEFGINEKEVKGLKFSNGFEVDLRTANKNSKIEGFTYDLIITDETQDISGYIMSKSLSPMRAATGGSMIHLGTPIPSTCYFSESCFRNKALDIKNNAKGLERTHYEFNYTHPSRNNPLYKQSIEKEKDRLGEYSDEFRMAYNIEWLQSRGTLISHDEIKRCGVIATSTEKCKVVPYNKDPYTTSFKRCSHIVSSDINTKDQVFSIDFGKVNDSTVFTSARVWWDNPILVGDDYRYNIHINDWIELSGSDHEQQHPDIHKAIKKYAFSSGIVDATGRGDPIYSRLSGELIRDKIDLHPFVFTSKSKHEGYTLLKQEINSGRVTFPYSKTVRTYRKHRAFIKQITNLVKEYKSSNYMKISHPKLSGHHDDYADSLMMLVWVVNMIGRTNINMLNTGTDRSSRFARNLNHKARNINGRSQPKSRFWRR